MTIGERIRQAREHGPAAKVSRKELAAAAGIAYSTLADVENGLSASTTALHRIAKHLKVRVEWLETGKGAMAHSQSVRLDPEIVRSVVQVLQQLYEDELHRPYVITEEPDVFVELYQRTIERGSTEGSLFWLGTRVREHAPQGAMGEERKNADDRGHRKRNA